MGIAGRQFFRSGRYRTLSDCIEGGSFWCPGASFTSDLASSEGHWGRPQGSKCRQIECRASSCGCRDNVFSSLSDRQPLITSLSRGAQGSIEQQRQPRLRHQPCAWCLRYNGFLVGKFRVVSIVPQQLCAAGCHLRTALLDGGSNFGGDCADSVPFTGVQRSPGRRHAADFERGSAPAGARVVPQNARVSIRQGSSPETQTSKFCLLTISTPPKFLPAIWM